jgi:isoamylase
MGDEMRRTQLGNNNAWCQDGPVSWLDWGLLERHRDVHRFLRRLAAIAREIASAESDWLEAEEALAEAG